ncbi:hypothetical protein HYS91_01095 [Candidatus Daviesbacteria bacterium]|nr:hypothetical protein [Candidatus Daviesbacteria bacterium]
MKQQTFNQVTGIIFAVIAILHLLRFFLGWEASIAGWVVPTWFSILGLVVAGYLAYSAFKLKN